MASLLLVDRIDCEDEGPNTDIESLTPKFIDLSGRGFAMPTVLVRCAGKNPAGPVGSRSTVAAVRRLRDNGSPIGIHVHANLDPSGNERMVDLTHADEVRPLLEEACERFCSTFSAEARILGMGHTACSNEEVAALLYRFGIRLDLGDLYANKYAFAQKVKLFDYTTASWNSDWPIYKHKVWWIPTGTDGAEGAAGPESLCLAYSLYYGFKQDIYLFRKIFARYAKLAETAPDRDIIISTLVHPPETLKRWDAWVYLHEIAADAGFESITSEKALEMLVSQSDHVDSVQ